MAEPQKKNPLGPTGNTVADNIKRLRGDMQYVKLAARLEEIGRPIPTLGLRKIESYERRVDADDLVALAVALEVSPVTLLMPASAAPESVVEATATGELSAEELFAWLQGNAPLPQQRRSASRRRALPEWYIAEEDDRMKRHVREQADQANLADRVGAMEAELKRLRESRGDH